MPLLVSLLILVLFLSVRTERCESVEVAEFSTEVSYLEALLLLGDKTSLESLVDAGGIEIVEREWDSFEFGRVHKISHLEASGQGRFKAKSLSGEFGGDMLFVQSVHASREGMTIKSEMSSPCGHVKSHVNEISLSNSRPVKVRVENRLVYERQIPFWLADRMRSSVAGHNKSRLQAVTGAMKAVLSGHPAKTAHQ